VPWDQAAGECPPNANPRFALHERWAIAASARWAGPDPEPPVAPDSLMVRKRWGSVLDLRKTRSASLQSNRQARRRSPQHKGTPARIDFDATKHQESSLRGRLRWPLVQTREDAPRSLACPRSRPGRRPPTPTSPVEGWAMQTRLAADPGAHRSGAPADEYRARSRASG
jgi:hypothetical protein